MPASSAEFRSEQLNALKSLRTKRRIFYEMERTSKKPMSDPTPQEKLDRIIAYHADLRRFRELMAVQETAEDEARTSYGEKPEAPAELDQLRQSLLYGSGFVQPIFERVIRR